MTADLVEEFESDLRDRGAAAHEQLVAAVGQSPDIYSLGFEPFGLERVAPDGLAHPLGAQLHRLVPVLAVRSLAAMATAEG